MHKKITKTDTNYIKQMDETCHNGSLIDYLMNTITDKKTKIMIKFQDSKLYFKKSR